MLLFVLACGLSVTLGLMNFINLAHGAFAMAGGYCAVVVVNRLGYLSTPRCQSHFSSPPCSGPSWSARFTARVRKNPPGPGVVHIGLVFMSVAAVDYVAGSQQVFVKLPASLEGAIRCDGRRHRAVPAAHHRRVRAACGCASICAGAHPFRQPAARGRGRPRTARGMGINVNAVFRRHVRGRLRTGRARRCTGRGDPRA